MAFRRSRYGSRRYRRGGTVGGGFRSVRRYRRLQPRLIRSPPMRVVHFFGTASTAAVPSLAALFAASSTLLNPITRGTSILNRLGNRIQMMSLVLTGEIKFNPFRSDFTTFQSSGAITAQWQLQQDCSIVIAYCPDRKLTTPDLSEYYSPDADGVVSTWSLPRIDTLPSMKILYRRDYQFRSIENFSGTAGQNYTAPSVLKRVKIKLPLNLRTSYTNSATGVPLVADIDAGALYFFFLGDYAGVTPAGYNRPVFSFESRLAFTNLD